MTDGNGNTPTPDGNGAAGQGGNDKAPALTKEVREEIRGTYGKLKDLVRQDGSGRERLPMIVAAIIAVIVVAINANTGAQWDMQMSQKQLEELVKAGKLVDGELVRFVGGTSQGLMTAAVTQLGILFVIALFLERGLDVFVSIWRRRDREAIEALSRKVNKYAGNPDYDNDMPALPSPFAVDELLRRYRDRTRRITTSVSLCVGLVIALVGPRLFNAVFQASSPLAPEQRFGMETIDLLLTAGLIAGGTAVIHPMVASLTGFFKASNEQLKAAGAK